MPRQAILGKQPSEQLHAFVETIVLSVLENPALRDIHGDAFVSMRLLVPSLPEQQQHPAATAFAVLGMAENVTWLRPGGGALRRLRRLDVSRARLTGSARDTCIDGCPDPCHF